MKWSISATDVKKLEKLLDLKGKKLLFYHNDADGICSAAMMLRFFSGFESDVRKGPVMDDGFIRDLIAKKPGLVVFLDLPVDQEWKKLGKIQKALPGLRIVIIDHHIYEKNLNSKSVLHINTRFRSDGYIPATAMVYELLTQMGKGVKPLLWIAGIGVIGDYGWEDCAELMDECRRRYPKLIGRGQDPLKSKFWDAAEMISAAVTLNSDAGARKCLAFMQKAGSFEEFIAEPELGSWRKEVDEEFERVAKRFKKDSKEYPGGVIALEIRTSIGLNSAVATYVSERRPDSIVVVRREIGKGDNKQWKLSLRCQSGRVNLGGLTKKAVKNIGSGGGHAKAAGALVKEWNVFIKRFVRLLTN